LAESFAAESFGAPLVLSAVFDLAASLLAAAFFAGFTIFSGFADFACLSAGLAGLSGLFFAAPDFVVLATADFFVVFAATVFLEVETPDRDPRTTALLRLRDLVRLESGSLMSSLLYSSKKLIYELV
jgi:hypothetical protein